MGVRVQVRSFIEGMIEAELEDVAVPYLFVTASPRAQRIAHGRRQLGQGELHITVIASLGFIRTVSFQPISLGSGGNGFPTSVMPVEGSPVKACRRMTWTLQP